MSRKEQQTEHEEAGKSRVARRRERQKYNFSNFLVYAFLLVPILVFLLISLISREQPRTETTKTSGAYEEVFFKSKP
ncbi:hypothetical protein [Ectobacillus ponti]|uniref:Uncharacterized protein n=1 Tax=Ectobacillus ponti TaxID=2961894 RepID=A0AA42BSR6_9BACI|nr:hypothetical protein [Ectobacillus ponti]MCP8968728.1 hypothetical protein [Ectobacillus ponti]